MNKKLDCILLIDDDESTNFINRIIIERENCTHQIEVADNVMSALDFLTTYHPKHSSPELVFLDINMPGLDGWEFLEEYEKIKEEQNPTPIIIMLTASINPDDEKKARKKAEVSDFKCKPLSADDLRTIMEKYFDT
jgi:CheY-like chemotaxis protein